MNIGFVGLGAVVETAWLPALRRLSLPVSTLWGYDLDAQRTLPGVTCCESLA
ncbi:MAG: oxidoreductase, partial [Kluyvera intermedia]